MKSTQIYPVKRQRGPNKKKRKIEKKRSGKRKKLFPLLVSIFRFCGRAHLSVCVKSLNETVLLLNAI